MANNLDVAVLAKKIYELSVLTPEALEARKWEALLIIHAVYSSATPEGVAKAAADKEARWGDQIRAEGFMAALHPKWHLRSDDGKPPVVQIVLASALDNPVRDLRTRLQALMLVPPEERGPLTELARALVADAFDGAKGEAKDEYLNAARAISKTWFKEPWLLVLPHEEQPPVILILIDNQGETHDGGIWDDPTDDTEWEKIKFGWADAIRTWDVDFLRDNPLAQLYTKVEKAADTAVNVAGTAADTAGQVASGLNDAVKAMATIIKWTPWVLGGLGLVWAVTEVFDD